MIEKEKVTNLQRIKTWLTAENWTPPSSVNKSSARLPPRRRRCYFPAHYFQCKLLIWCPSHTKKHNNNWLSCWCGEEEKQQARKSILRSNESILSSSSLSSKTHTRLTLHRAWLCTEAVDEEDSEVCVCVCVCDASIFINRGPLGLGISGHKH